MAAGRPNKKANAVKKLLEKDPTMSTAKIAEKVGCHPYYVGRVKRDMGLAKPKAKKKSVSTQAATLGLVRKPKEKALQKTVLKQDNSRGALLDKAKEIITNDRQNTHGQPEDSFRRIADLWSGYLTVGVQEEDVAVMMALVKVARIMENPRHADNWIDGAGYFACGGEVALRRK